MSILAIILARAGSKRLPGKNANEGKIKLTKREWDYLNSQTLIGQVRELKRLQCKIIYLICKQLGIIKLLDWIYK